MTRFVLIRHGQTGWNKEARFRGRIDIDLDETGMRQAQAVGERFAQSELAAIYSSPLKRAMATAEPIGRRLNLQVVPLEGINDMNFGSWEGRSIDEVKEQDKELFDLWHYSPEKLSIPGGETLDDVRQRVAATMDDLAAKHEDDTVLLVTHRVVCKVLLCHLLGLDNSHFWQIAQDTTAVNRFQVVGGRSTVTLINDTCHLRGL
ncbi:MAG: histidine phosphatase family protein [Dehalococcoidia bacterium]|nr:histidine phosphatase family protein [Dehalococcoidia bacterium]